MTDEQKWNAENIAASLAGKVGVKLPFKGSRERDNLSLASDRDECKSSALNEERLDIILNALYEEGRYGVKTRLKLICKYGDELETEWGYVGRSLGDRSRLLIHNRRSLGGSLFPSLSVIVEVRTSRNGRLLWSKQ